MPIRFRCAYCNQLMGIARRKAGTVVRCPKCAGQVVVPIPQDNEEDIADAPGLQGLGNPHAGDGGLFEQSDFGKVFDQGPGAGPQLLQQPPVPHPAQGEPLTGSAQFPEYDAVPLSAGVGPAPRGVFLTSGTLAVVSALIVVLMGMAFFLGLLLGRSSQP